MKMFGAYLLKFIGTLVVIIGIAGVIVEIFHWDQPYSGLGLVFYLAVWGFGGFLRYKSDHTVTVR